MNIFEKVRESVTMQQVAELYSIDARRGMINCIFHDDKTPSMKLYDDHYYCFGCGAHGDAVAFAAQVTGLSQYEAAKQLGSAFGIVHSSNEPFIKPMIQRETQREKEGKAFRVLSDYYHLLCRFREEYAPRSQGEEPSPLFVESLNNQSEYENYCNIFISGTQEERKDFIENRREVLERAGKRVREYYGNGIAGRSSEYVISG